MGMFDYIHFKCPKCGGIAEDQTKADDCNLVHYYTPEVRPMLGDDEEREDWEPATHIILAHAERYGLECNYCGYEVQVRLACHPPVLM